MNSEHFDGVRLEWLVSRVFKSDHNGFAAFFSADHLLRKPFDAALVILARIYPEQGAKDIDEFMNTWRTVFEYPDENPEYTFDNYLSGLKALVEKYA